MKSPRVIGYREQDDTQARKGRGALSNREGRFEKTQCVPFDDGWGSLAEYFEEPPPLPTRIHIDGTRSILVKNDSPDIPFEQTLNPYKGCEHGCVYCYARSSHSFLGLSPGLDFESQIFQKPNAAQLLRKELAKPSYRCQAIAIGANTDCYQPIERKLGITRAVIQVLAEHNHPLAIISKSALVQRDLDLLAPMAAKGLVKVYVSVTSLDPALARKLEPRAAAPHKRLETIAAVSAAGIPTGVMVAPIIPGLNDAEIEQILAEAAARGASQAGYVLLRLPNEIEQLFVEWLRTHYPLKAEHVLSLLRQMRGGQLYEAQFGTRMRGQGPLADLLAKRFQLGCKRVGLVKRDTQLRTDLFEVPKKPSAQLDMDALWG